MPSFTVTLDTGSVTLTAETSDAAVDAALEARGLDFASFRTVYQDDPVPSVPGRYGAPMGRHGRPLCGEDEDLVATRVPLDEGGYDAGGAYWGLRPAGQALFAVQDGLGNMTFVDAAGPEGAVAAAMD